MLPAICLTWHARQAVEPEDRVGHGGSAFVEPANVTPLTSDFRKSSMGFGDPFWVASVISYPTQAEINADTTPTPPKKSAEIVAHLNTLAQNGSVNDHIPPSFWALVFVVFCVVIAVSGEYGSSSEQPPAHALSAADPFDMAA
jgi:hypothetical protein